ncbi:hypothetical protein SLE2022_170350 [Rubroshorea leprosula]
MKRAMLCSDEVDVISSDEFSSEAEVDGNDGTCNSPTEQPPQELSPQGTFKTWVSSRFCLSLQISHFLSGSCLLTVLLLARKQHLTVTMVIVSGKWEQLRFGSEDKDTPLDIIVHPCKAEATIWLIEETHRHTTSSHHMAKLWLSDPMHDPFVDPIFPEL